jgi:hypothetical protein
MEPSILVSFTAPHVRLLRGAYFLNTGSESGGVDVYVTVCANGERTRCEGHGDWARSAGVATYHVYADEEESL